MPVPSDVLYRSDIHQLECLHRGKVRDLYAAGPHELLMVTCDRISAFDVVMPDAVPQKGIVLNRISRFWFEKTRHIVPNHCLELTAADILADHPDLRRILPRSMVVRRLKPLPVEAIVRGYLAGSGWREYRQSGAVCGIDLPSGLEQADRLPRALFTPSTKAGSGHDENIDMPHLERLIGAELARKIERVSLSLYRFAADFAAARGIIIADTKFEFGLDDTGELELMDELLTPDSSRFWPAERYRTGVSPPSYDKQFLRDWLESLDWDKTPPAPPLPDEVIDQTRDRYLTALQTLTGEGLAPSG